MRVSQVSLSVVLSLLFAASVQAVDLSPYKVVWDSPSRDSLDSMPLSGLFGAGANVWVQDGSIWLYLAHNGAYDEQGRLLKLGCVRVTPVDGNLGRPASARNSIPQPARFPLSRATSRRSSGSPWRG